MRALTGGRGALLGAVLMAASAAGTLVVPSPAAAATTLTLYVRSGATGTSCTGPGATACGSIQTAVAGAATHAGADVTVTVGPGTYHERTISVDASTLASLDVVGAGATSTTVTSEGGQGFSVTAGTVSVEGLSVDRAAAASSAGGGMLVTGGSTVALADDTFATDSALTSGGVDVASGHATVTDVTFLRDHGAQGGGMGVGPTSSAVVTGTTFTTDAAHDGGGVAALVGSSVTLAGDTFTTDRATTDGGDVWADGGTLRLTSDTVARGNARTGGGVGIVDGATAALSNDTFTNDLAVSTTGRGGYGGGVLLRGATATLTDDQFSPDYATSTGSGITVTHSTAVLSSDTFATDFVKDVGSIVKVGNGTATLVNDTLALDGAATAGRLVGAFASVVTLRNDTLSTDAAPTGGGILNTSSVVRAANSIFANASCAGAVTDLGSNVETGDSCGFGATSINTSTSINLGPLAANTSAGPTTRAIGKTSSAFEAVPPSSCTPLVDERGKPRPGVPGHNCDAGAYEYQGHQGVSGRAVTAERIFGQTADGTAAAELASAFPPGACPGTAGDRPVVLATDQSPSDALASAYLAAALGTGTLLTPSTSLAPVTVQALRSEGITRVYVVGGPLAISTAVVDELGATPAYRCGGTGATGTNLEVTRIFGATAPTTAARIAATPPADFVGRLDLSGAYGGTNPSGGVGRFNTTAGGASDAPSRPGALATAIVATDRSFQDAESAAALSYGAHVPVLLTTPGSLPASTRGALVALGITQVVVMGGPLAVATSVVGAMRALGISVLRVAGADGTATSVALAGLETAPASLGSGLGWDARTPGFVVARGDYFADGLAGAVVAAHGRHASGPVPLLLTKDPSTLGSALGSYLRHAGATGIGAQRRPAAFLVVLGGPEAVTPSVVSTMESDLS